MRKVFPAPSRPTTISFTSRSSCSFVLLDLTETFKFPQIIFAGRLNAIDSQIWRNRGEVRVGSRVKPLTSIALGTVDDSGLGGSNADQA
jgi:hypothetical protein